MIQNFIIYGLFDIYKLLRLLKINIYTSLELIILAELLFDIISKITQLNLQKKQNIIN